MDASVSSIDKSKYITSWKKLERVFKKTYGTKNIRLRKRNSISLVGEPGCKYPKSWIKSKDVWGVVFRENLSLLQKSKTIKKSPFYPLNFCGWVRGFFRSHAAYWEAAETKMVTDLLARKKTRNLQMLYPAGASHVGPLDFFHRLIQQNKIDSATVVFTEISKSELDNLKLVLQNLEKRGVYSGLSIATEKFPEISGGSSETIFKFEYRGKPIKLIFALRMSGKKYYHEKYLANSDILVIHDPLNGQLIDSVNILNIYLQSLVANQKTGDSPIIIMENLADSGQAEYDFFSNTRLRGDRKIIPYPSGHHSSFGRLFDEGGIAKFSSTLVFRPDLKNFWKLLTKGEIKSVLDLHASCIDNDRLRIFPDLASGRKIDFGEFISDQQWNSISLKVFFKETFVRALSAAGKLEKSRPKYSEMIRQDAIGLYNHVKPHPLAGKVLSIILAKMKLTTRLAHQQLPVPGQVKIFPLGKNPKLAYRSTGKKNLPELYDFPGSSSAIIPAAKLGYTFNNLPSYSGLYDRKGKFAGLVRMDEGIRTDGPAYYKYANSQLLKAKKTDFLFKYSYLIKSGQYHVVLEDPNGERVVGLISKDSQ
ncbi:MAG: hypothetical protein HQ564_02395 [Candidatus Saganbacteria bacterium]|nr:hypothetical protein [Candidatus Saganbacteria bacterium]